MRTHLPILIAAAVLASPANGATRNFGITGFDRIRVDGPYRVRLTNGVAPFATASGGAAAIDRIAIEMMGRTLVVRTNPSWGGYPGKDRGPVEINIGTHELSSATLNGSGLLQIDRVKGLNFQLSVQGSGAAEIAYADVDNLRVALAGTAGAIVAGRAGKLTAAVRGISSLDATGLSAKDADIGAEGPATVKAQVGGDAKITASGTATVSLAGNPACLVTVTGSATVSGCRSTQ